MVQKTKQFDILIFSRGTPEQAERQLSLFNNEVWDLACNWGARRYNLTIQDVEDQVQWTLNKVWNRRDTFNSLPELRGFLFKTLGWRCLQFVQRKRGHLSTVEALLSEESCYSNSYEHKNFTKVAIEYISIRKPLWGRIMYLYYVDGLEGQEIQTLTGVPTPSVYDMKKKSIALLREWYSADEVSDYILPPKELWGKIMGAVREVRIRVPRPVVTPRIKMRPFEEAHAFVLSLNLKSRKEWEEFCHSGKRPNDIPVAPDNSYHEEYRTKCPGGMEDWLGYDRSYAAYEEVEQFMREKMVPMGILTGVQWSERYDELRNRGVIPSNIPKKIDQYYKGKGFTAWGIMTGLNRYVKRRKEQILPYKLAKEYVQGTLVPLGITTIASYKENCSLIPSFLPHDPIRFYGKAYKGPKDFFGIAKRRSLHSSRWPYEKARQWVIKNLVNSRWEINTSSRWMNYIADKYPKAPKLPADIPRDPRYYKKNGAQWVDWNHWFGTTADEREQKKMEEEKEVFAVIYKMRNKKLMSFRSIGEELDMPENKVSRLYVKYVPDEERLEGYLYTPFIPKEDQEEILRLHAEGEISQHEIARRFNISQGFVNNIIWGKSVTELKTRKVRGVL